ncbi:MAG TPA: hypothetical protein VGQ59_10600 [Cyclobacteriaceae bacterium]|jgi:hypothetical protein|nr:hypothetical protein [Cyclobacteriaceae bacterium]
METPEDDSKKPLRHRLRHYLYEFLMLFLAVFCGFLAENQREHMAEREMEKEYMNTMLEDLKADGPLLDSIMGYWNEVNRNIDSVTDAISFPLTKTDLPKVYSHVIEATNYWSFKYNDRTVAQLKNSGGFLVIRNKEVTNKIIAYDQFNRTAIEGIDTQHNKFYENATASRSKALSEEIITAIYNRYGFKSPPPSAHHWVDSLISINRVLTAEQNQSNVLFEFKNALIALKRDYTINVTYGYEQLKLKNNELIKLIQENYPSE